VDEGRSTIVWRIVLEGRMRTEALALPGVLLVHADVLEDARGFFMELHNASRYAEVGISAPFVQDNHSRSTRGVLRGMHYQLTQPQGKLVTVLRGSIYDVVADVRPDSPTFGEWVGVRLGEGSGRQLWVPPGYAHGFCVYSDVADVLYKCTDLYAADDGRGIRWDDPQLGITWPVSRPILSGKDARLPTLAEVSPDQLPRLHTA
jgi:dTDP-4-dehydrorhamnose 3,5-epimerase